MNFTSSVKSCFKKYCDCSGRASRSEFWYFKLFEIIVGSIAPYMLLALCALFLAASNQSPAGDFNSNLLLENPLIYFSFYVPLAVLFGPPSFCVNVRRLHDVNKSAWWLLIALTVIGLLYLFYLFCKKGGEKNAYDDLEVSRRTKIITAIFLIPFSVIADNATSRFSPVYFHVSHKKTNGVSKWEVHYGINPRLLLDPREQKIINDRFIKYAYTGDEEKLRSMFKENVKQILDQGSINQGFWMAATRGHLGFVKEIIKQGIVPSKETIRDSFVLAGRCSVAVMEWMLKEKLITPDQECINDTFLKAFKDVSFAKVGEWMIKNKLAPNQDGVNFAFIESFEQGAQERISWLLKAGFKPNQNGIDRGFNGAMQFILSNKRIAGTLIFLLKRGIKPDKKIMAEIYKISVENNLKDLAKELAPYVK